MATQSTAARKKAAPEATVQTTILSMAEAAQFLRLSSVYLRVLARRGEGPRRVRIGRRCLYRQADLLAWVDAHATDTPDPAA